MPLNESQSILTDSIVGDGEIDSLQLETKGYLGYLCYCVPLFLLEMLAAMN